jgi:hypothetical protein
MSGCTSDGLSISVFSFEDDKILCGTSKVACNECCVFTPESIESLRNAIQICNVIQHYIFEAWQCNEVYCEWKHNVQLPLNRSLLNTSTLSKI